MKQASAIAVYGKLRLIHISKRKLRTCLWLCF